MQKFLLNEISKSYNIMIIRYINSNPWTKTYGLSRTFLAISLFITLIFTPINELYPSLNGVLIKIPIFEIEKISIFYLFREYRNLVYIFSLFILIIVILGYLPQITGFFHWWITFSYMVSTLVLEGGDQIASIITLLLIPICLTDNRINHWYKPKKSNNNYLKLFIWSIYVIISLQVAIIYLHAAVGKLYVEEWLNGTSTYYWFTHDIFGISKEFRHYIVYLLSNSFIVTSITWGTIIFELILFGWIFMKKNYWNWKLLLIFGIMFHFGIALIHGLVSFMFTMFGALTLYFVPTNFQKLIK